jgi:hypothetical protein
MTSRSFSIEAIYITKALACDYTESYTLTSTDFAKLFSVDTELTEVACFLFSAIARLLVSRMAPFTVVLLVCSLLPLAAATPI